MRIIQIVCEVLSFFCSCKALEFLSRASSFLYFTYLIGYNIGFNWLNKCYSQGLLLEKKTFNIGLKRVQNQTMDANHTLSFILHVLTIYECVHQPLNINVSSNFT